MPPPPPLGLSEEPPARARSVGEFMRATKREVESRLGGEWVEGEVANFTRAASGHWYFVLRDSDAQVDCVMLARENRAAPFTPKTGDKILVYGRPSIYAPRGRFQLAVARVRASGLGRLYREFVERKRAWQERGWFANARPLPFLPARVGLVCSPAGAAVRDVLRALRGRWRGARVVLYPAPAQGAGAAQKIADAIHVAGARGECDVLLVCRGGGGIEDLWAYNEEPVVTAIWQSPIPVITGIGHEVDETLADYAADKRAISPTAAAVAAVPDATELLRAIGAQATRLAARARAGIDERAQNLDWRTKFLTTPGMALEAKRGRWQQAAANLSRAAGGQMAGWQSALAARFYVLRLPQTATLRRQLAQAARRLPVAAAASLQAAEASWAARARALQLLDPRGALRRGYSIVYNAAGGVVNSAASLRPQERVRMVFNQGEARALVEEAEANADADNKEGLA